MPAHGMNKAILVGHVEEPRYSATKGRPRLMLKVHVVEAFEDEHGAGRERHAWHRVVVWGKFAEALAPVVVAGRRVMVEGRIVHRAWDGRDGKRVFQTEIHASEVRLFDARAAPVPDAA